MPSNSTSARLLLALAAVALSIPASAQSVNLLSIGNAKALNPITTAQLNAMPLPNNTEAGDGLNAAGYRFNVPGTDPSDKYVGRFDQELLQSQKWGYHTLEFVFNRAERLLRPDTLNGWEAPFPGGVDAYQSSTRTLMATAIHSVFGPRVTNEARFGHQRVAGGFFRDRAPDNPFFINLGSVTDYDHTFLPQDRTTPVYQLLDNFAWIRGAHTLRMGMDFQSASAITFNSAGTQAIINLGTNSANPDGITNSSFPYLPAGAAGAAIANRARAVFADITGFLGSAVRTYNVASPTSGFVNGATRQRNFKQRSLALYIQDEWRMRRNLTLSSGLRWEWQGVPCETLGLATQPANGLAGLWGISGPGNLFNPGSLRGAAPTFLDFVNGGTGRKLYGDDWNNFAPFVGVAFQPVFNSGPLKRLFGAQGRSSIRMGFSISYLQDGTTVIGAALGGGTSNPGLSTSSANNTPTGILDAGGVQIPVPAFKMPVSDAENMLVNSNNGLSAFDPNLRVPYVQQWSLGIEREVARGWVVEARYVGNHAVKALRAIDYNEVNIFENGFLDEFRSAKKNLDINLANGKGSTFADNGLPGQLALPIHAILFAGLPAAGGFGNSSFVNNLNLGYVGATASTLAFSSTYRVNRARLAPNFFVANPNAAFARVLTNASFSNYNSLQAELRKRPLHGLYLQAGYTFSKALTDSEGSGSHQEDFRTLRDLKLDRHRANYDQTHRFIGNFIYELPFGRERRWGSGSPAPLRKLIEGWQLGGIVNWQTGGPIAIYSNRSTFNAANPGLNPAQLTGATFPQIRDAMGVYKTGMGMFFINPSMLDITTDSTTGRLTGATLKEGVLGAPAPGTIGNMPRNNINGPPFTQFDFSVIKRTWLAEQRNLQLKVNFLNAFNQPSFAFASAIFDDANFARITSTRSTARIVTFILSLNF